MSQKIIIVSSGQPTLNPRLVKEADALCDAGYEVTVLYAYWNAWGTAFDKQLIPTKKWHSICIAGDPEHERFTYFLSKIIYRIAKKINSIFDGKILADPAIARSAFFLKREAKRHRADMYIAHNIGALPAVIAAAKTDNKPCGFDAEDFHRHEISNDVNNTDVKLKAKIEDKYFSKLNYFTTSSPQIADAYHKIYAYLKPAVLLNVFPKSQIKQKADISGPIKLLWFSQTIGPNRGISDIVDAVRLLDKQQFELHLLGSKQYINTAFINKLTNSGIDIKFHEPMHPGKLVGFAAQFDIGLALEPGFSINNNLALSNKIFTYMQAGLAIVASDTLAQKDFIDKNPTIGRVYPNDNVSALADILLNFQHDAAFLAGCKKESLRLAQTKYNWETESRKFLDIVKQTLDN